MMADGAGMERSVWALSARKVDLILEVKGSDWSDMVAPRFGKTTPAAAWGRSQD